jgi:hypothetical protein
MPKVKKSKKKKTKSQKLFCFFSKALEKSSPKNLEKCPKALEKIVLRL